MKLSFPHMGNAHIIFKTIARSLSFDYLTPPPLTQKTLKLGTRYSPESICLPFKINLGNFIEALEAGADTLAMAGGVGACRFGYYWKIQDLLLREAGFSFEMLPLNQINMPDVYKRLEQKTDAKPFLPLFIKSFFLMWQKAKLLHKIENLKREISPFEINKGEAAKTLLKALMLLDNAASYGEIKGAEKRSLEIFNLIPKDPERKPLKIGIVGEVYVTLEPFANVDLENKLSRLGVKAHNSMSLYKWLKYIFHLDRFEKTGRHNIEKTASPYLRYNPGGEAQASVAKTIMYAKEGFDGVINIYPFSCMPGLISSAILANVSRDYNIPVLNLSVDEHTAETGFLTRLEAFVDLLRQKKLKKN